jgi:3-oxoacyl-[acyl-carrier-protein] synthase II
VTRIPAAITGAGAVTPLGIGVDIFHRSWKAGVCGIADGVGACSEFDATNYMTRKEARRTDRFVHFAIAACQEAVDAAWGGELPYDPSRIACVLGVSFGGTGVICEQYDMLKAEGPDAVWTMTAPVAMPNAPPAILAIRHGFHGETNSVASACASSAQAIALGLRMLRLEEADAVIVGGTEACLSELILAAFRTAGALSLSGISRPFDRARDGFVMGEGAGILILEHPERAQERGATILGYLAGAASTTDGHHITAPEKSGATCAMAMQRALADAGLAPADVDWVNAHGTSTPSNDRAETTALKLALGDHAYAVPVSAPKSVIGHLIGAAGAVEAVATLSALRDRIAPPTVGLEHPEEGLDLNYVPGGPVELVPRNGNGNGTGSAGAGGRLVALSNSFAFGGHNASLVITA